METENIIMFSIGLTIFVLYMIGYLFMVKKANELQKSKLKNDPDLTAPYRRAIILIWMELVIMDGFQAKSQGKK